MLHLLLVMDVQPVILLDRVDAPHLLLVMDVQPVLLLDGVDAPHLLQLTDVSVLLLDGVDVPHLLQLTDVSVLLLDGVDESAARTVVGDGVELVHLLAILRSTTNKNNYHFRSQ